MTLTETKLASLPDKGAKSLPQQPGLSLLLAEMTALSALIPGFVPVKTRSEAEIEADFDNMPV